jgi:phage gpG-like protein
MAVAIEVVVRSADVEALLDRLTRRLDDDRPQLLRLVDQLLEAERERFAGRGARWRKLAPSTVKQKRRDGDPRPMIHSGRTMRSLTVRGNPDQRIVIRRDSLTFGTRVYYARFHQKGKGVPKRTLVGLTRVQKQGVASELRRLLLEDL